MSDNASNDGEFLRAIESLKMASEALKNLLNISILLCAGLLAYAGAIQKGLNFILVFSVLTFLVGAVFGQLGLFACVSEGTKPTPDAFCYRIRFFSQLSSLAVAVGIVCFILDVGIVDFWASCARH